MNGVVTIGLDLAKMVFQVHGADAEGKKLFSRKLQRSELLPFLQEQPQCTVAMEASIGSHWWARQIQALGHTAKIIPSQYVKPFVKRDKTDVIDAEAISTAAVQEGMRFVPVKTGEQQALTTLLKTRSLFSRQRTGSINALRAFMTEIGTVFPVGHSHVAKLIAIVRENPGEALPSSALPALLAICDQIDFLNSQIGRFDKEIASRVKSDKEISRLMTIPGIGPLTAVAIKAYAPDANLFKSARHFAAWIGLTPRIHSSGGKAWRGRITKMGNRELRRLLVFGAFAVIRDMPKQEHPSMWLRKLISRKPYKVAAVAIANKTARMAWALLTKGGIFLPRQSFAPSRPSIA